MENTRAFFTHSLIRHSVVKMAAAANSKKATNICTSYENPVAMSTNEDPKKASMFTAYEIKWETFGRGRKDFLGQKRDFPLMQEISNWLFDLAHFNSDDTSLVEKEWHLIHVSPRHLFIFLTLCAKNLQKWIHYPFKAPGGGWSSRPLPSATWTEHRHIDYWDFLAKRQQVRDQAAFSKTHMRIV